MKSASALYYEKIMFEVIKRRRKMKEQKLENEYYILSKMQITLKRNASSATAELLFHF